jgi:hypothetical protein
MINDVAHPIVFLQREIHPARSRGRGSVALISCFAGGVDCGDSANIECETRCSFVNTAISRAPAEQDPHYRMHAVEISHLSSDIMAMSASDSPLPRFLTNSARDSSIVGVNTWHGPYHAFGPTSTMHIDPSVTLPPATIRNGIISSFRWAHATALPWQCSCRALHRCAAACVGGGEG